MGSYTFNGQSGVSASFAGTPKLNAFLSALEATQGLNYNVASANQILGPNTARVVNNDRSSGASLA